ncbi:hypothetical protein [Taibaiella koreensis]|uniref:hypothetical protein n=1 Tax=Taibaiella koreensis TaxID=1268548 RepID=UPI0013C2E82F|nr:hypothetical protein [Taibaiella koreensis]
MPGKYLLALVLIFSSVVYNLPVAGQHKWNRRRDIPEPPPVSTDRKDYECVCRPVPLAKRLKKYPFHKASRVVLVSFLTPGTPLFPVDSLDLRDYGYDYVHVPAGENETRKGVIEESVVLNEGQIDSLAAILYGYGYRKRDLMPPRTMTGCYAPHNAILFYNDQDECFAFIELCFSCEGMRQSDDEVDAGNFCTGKYQMLRSFFKRHQIRIGTIQIPLVKLCCDSLK